MGLAGLPRRESVLKLKSRDCVTSAALAWSGLKGLSNVGISRALKVMLLRTKQETKIKRTLQESAAKTRTAHLRSSCTDIFSMAS